MTQTISQLRSELISWSRNKPDTVRSHATVVAENLKILARNEPTSDTMLIVFADNVKRLAKVASLTQAQRPLE